MKLTEIIDTVLASQPEDWHMPGGDPPMKHDSLAVLMSNPAVALAWGRTVSDPYDRPWATRFADSHAVSFRVHILYHGLPVFQEVLASVDGHRCYLPIPFGEDLRIAPAYAGFAWLVASIECACEEFNYYFRRAGLTCSDDLEWPCFN